MPVDIALSPSLPLYMVGTTVVRVLVYLFGIFWIARLAPLRTISKLAGSIILTVFLAGWPLLIINLSQNNVFRIDANTPFPPPIIFGVVSPIIIGYLAYHTWPTWRQIIRHTPQHWLIGIQIFRITGGALLLLYLRGLLPGEFALPVGLGDILIGVTAAPVAYFYYRRKPWSRPLAYWWNYIGIFDFVLAVPLGILTSPGPVHMLALDNPNFLTTTFPLVLFPLFSVPAGVIIHIYSLAMLNEKGEARVRTIAQTLSWRLVLSGAVFVLVYVVAFYIASPLLTNRPLGWQIHPAIQETLATHQVGLYVHIVPSLLAIVAGPFQFLEGLRNRHLKLHRLLGRLYLLGVLLGGVGGLYMAFFSFAGPIATAGFALLAIIWLGTGAMAYAQIRRGQIETHRQWMIRNYALTFAAVTLRIYTRTFVSMGFILPEFHFINAWLCWLPNLLVAEWIIMRSRARDPKSAVPTLESRA